MEDKSLRFWLEDYQGKFLWSRIGDFIKDNLKYSEESKTHLGVSMGFSRESHQRKFYNSKKQ